MKAPRTSSKNPIAHKLDGKNGRGDSKDTPSNRWTARDRFKRYRDLALKNAQRELDKAKKPPVKAAEEFKGES